MYCHVGFRIDMMDMYTVSIAGAKVLLMCHTHCVIYMVGLAKCGHALAACERHYDIPWNFPVIGSPMVLSL